MQLKRSVALLMAVGLVAAACGDADDDTTADGTTTTIAGGAAGDGDGGENGNGDGDVAPEDIETGAGVTDEVIRVGMITDYSGIFAPLVVEIADAHKAYFEKVNDEGGIAGRMIEPVERDAGYDVPRHIEIYQQMRQDSAEGVAMLSLSVGSPHTASVTPEMEQDDMVAIPLTWYSGWADPDFGAPVAEMYTTYCLESHNAISWMHDRLQADGEETRLAIISFPGEYGQDGATGAKLAAEALGIEIVYDGEGQVVPGADQTPVISSLITADPTLVYATINPTALSEIFGGARARGLEALWTGNSPTFDHRLLDTDLAADLSDYYFYSTYTALWGTDVDGMDELMAEMAERRPEAPVSDPYIIGWTYAQLAHQLLEHAASRGDLTRAGIMAAFNDEAFTADFGGLAPRQTWAGDPDDYLVRDSYMYSVDHTTRTIVPVSQEGGSTGLVLEEGPFTADITADYTWDGPCFAPQG
jgi:ABC-type branched-subunit amino acid transport system substrate-binding protein